MTNTRAILFLAVLTPCVEFLTGSTSFASLFVVPTDAFVFVVLTLPGYIFPVLLIREALLVWKKGLPSMLALGIAYGAVNEGLTAKTYFSVNPLSPVLGSGVGRWIGVNWPWVTGITLFHMIVSMSVPLVLCYLLFPEARAVRFLTGRQVRWMIGILLAEIVGVMTIQATFSLTFRGLLPLMLLPAAIVGLGIYAAQRLPLPDPARWLRGPLARPAVLVVAGAAFFVVTFLPILRFFPVAFVPDDLLYQALWATGPVAGVVATVYPLLLAVLAIRFFTQHSLTDPQLIALTAGVMLVPLATALSVHDIPSGDWAAALLYLAAIVVAWRRTRARAEPPVRLVPSAPPAAG